MGFVLTILYLVTNYLTPVTLFGPLAEYRIELILAVLIVLVSLPRLIGSFIFRTPQSLALIGLALATMLSVLVGGHWAGGAVKAFLDFIPNAFAFFLVCLHCNSRRKLQVVVLMLLGVCLFVIARGSIDLLHLGPESAAVQPGTTDNDDENVWNMEHPYLLEMKNDQKEVFYRIRGLGSINDPNDFGQLLVCATPLMFIFWRKKKMLLNILFVVLPVCVLLFGVYLTHSRGALLALMAMAIVAARRRIGTLPALLLAGVLFAGAMALNFTGGRDISAGSGSDRTALWGEGLEIFRAHAVFGVGFGNMSDYTDTHQTAHNSLVVCAAELGFFGLYFWSLFLLPTVRDALTAASPMKVTEGEPIVPEESPSLSRSERLRRSTKRRSTVWEVWWFVAHRLPGCGVVPVACLCHDVLSVGRLYRGCFPDGNERKMIGSRLPLPRTPGVFRRVGDFAGTGHVHPAAGRQPDAYVLIQAVFMKIAHVVDSMEIGGAEMLVMQMCRLQREQGHDPCVYAIAKLGELGEQLQKEGFVVQTHVGRHLPDAAWNFYRLFRASRPNAVHLHNSRPTIYAAMAARMAGVPSIVSTRHGLVDPPHRRVEEFKYRFAAHFCDWVVGICDATANNLKAIRSAPARKTVRVYNGTVRSKEQRRKTGRRRADSR